MIVVRWVRRIAAAGRTVHRAGRAVHRAGQTVRRAGRAVQESGEDGKDGKDKHGAGEAVNRASKHIDLDGPWQDESSSTHRHERPEHATPTPGQILHELESEDPQRRLAAYRRVADMGPEGAPFLQGLLTDERPKVRRWAAESLAHLRGGERDATDAARAPGDGRPPLPPVAARQPLPLPPRAKKTPAVVAAEAVPATPAPETPEPETPEAVATPSAAAMDVDGPALAKRLLAFSRLSRLDPAYGEDLATLRAQRKRFALQAERAQPTRAFDAAPSLRNGTTLLGVIEGADVPVAVRIPKNASAEEGPFGGVLLVEAEFVGWDAIYDRAVFEGVRLD